MGLATTKMSSRGQVVIPEEIRKELELKEGARFVVLHHGDAVIFKIISAPSADEFRSLLKKVRSQVKKAGIKKSDVNIAIKRVREKNGHG